MKQEQIQKTKARPLFKSRWLGLAAGLLLSFATMTNAQVVVNDNGGFESSAVTVGADTSSVQSWWFQFNDKATASIVSDVVFNGDRALKIDIEELADNSWDIQIVNENIPLEPGETYTFSAWARTAEGSAKASFTMGNLSYEEFGRVGEVSLNETWKEVSFDFSATGSNGSIQVSDSTGRAALHLSYAGNEGKTLYFDDLKISKSHTNDNGSFEASEVTVSGDTTAVRGWTFELQGGGEATFEIVDDESYDGNNSLAVTVTTKGSNAYSIQAVNEPFNVVPGETYEFSVWAKASKDGTSAHLTVGDPSFSESLRFEQSKTLTTEWKEFTTTFNIPASGSTEARAPLHFSFTENVGETIYIDRLRITQVSGTQEEISKLPIIIEAESAEMGDEWAVLTDGDVEYVSITTDYNETTGAAGYPGEGRTLSYTVTFPQSGDYDLFARLRVGPKDFDDDSFFEGNGFGEKDPSNSGDWFVINGMASGGFNQPSDLVRDDAGGLGSGVWKWVNLSRASFQNDTTLTWSVTGKLTKTIQFGGREDGLDIDKFAFGRSELYFTVDNLDKGEAGSETDPSIAPPKDLEPIAKGKTKWLGNVYSSSQITDFAKYWNQVTPENAGKWGSVEATRDQMNWGQMDAAYALAKDNGFPIRFHILVWGGQQPNWINDLGPEDQLAEIREWMEAVAARYPDLDYVEVVNEGSNGHQLPDGISGEANYIEALGGTGETGYDWIITAFQMAREIFPAGTKLMINDYGIVGNSSATTKYLAIINSLKDLDLIDAIGVQSHAFSTKGSTNTAITSTLNRLGATGLPIQATEFEIDGRPSGTDAESDQTQLQEFQRVFPLFWEHPDVEGMTLWGWKPGLWRNEQEAFLMRSNGEERPALQWLREYVENYDVSISDDGLISENPTQFKLYNNYPNPFNPTTQIKYDLPAAMDVKITVFDTIGRTVQTLVNSQKPAGSHTVTFNAAGLSSGVYFYRIEAGDFSNVKRMMLIK